MADEGSENSQRPSSKRELSPVEDVDVTPGVSTKRRQNEKANHDMSKKDGGSDCTNDTSKDDGGDINKDAEIESSESDDVMWGPMELRSSSKLINESVDTKQHIPSGAGDQCDDDEKNKDYNHPFFTAEENDEDLDDKKSCKDSDKGSRSPSKGSRDDGVDDESEPVLRLSRIICVKRDGGDGGKEVISENDSSGGDEEKMFVKPDCVEKLGDDDDEDDHSDDDLKAGGGDKREEDDEDDHSDDDKDLVAESYGIEIEYGVGVVYPRINPLPSALRELVISTYNGMPKEPSDAKDGTSLAYLMYGASNQHVAVFKPKDGEAENSFEPGAGLRKGTIKGEGYIREAAAYLLDLHSGGNGERGAFGSDCEIGFSGVPPTCIVNIWGPMCVNDISGIGSLQKFIPNEGDCLVGKEMIKKISVDEVHKIAIVDIRFANADRHQGNILRASGQDGRCQLIPIDHGYCFPSTFEDCRFDWMSWPQAGIQFSETECAFIDKLSAEEDISLLRSWGWNMASANMRVFRAATMLLKMGAKKGWSPFQIGEMMTRSSRNSNVLSVIESHFDILQNDIFPPDKNGDDAFIKEVTRLMDEHQV